MPSITLDRILYEWTLGTNMPEVAQCKAECVCVCVWAKGEKRERERERQTDSQPVGLCVWATPLAFYLPTMGLAILHILPWQLQLSRDFIVLPSCTSDFPASCRHPLFIMGVNNMLRYTSKGDGSNRPILHPPIHTHTCTGAKSCGYVCVCVWGVGSQNCSTGNDFEMGNNGTTFPIIYASLGLKHGSYYLRYNQYRLRSTNLRRSMK